jgi:peptidoglycan hydrolase CwlO-like protein
MEGGERKMKKISLLILSVIVISLICISCSQKNELVRVTKVYGELISYLSAAEFQAKLKEVRQNPDAITNLISGMNKKFDEIIKKNGFASEQDWRDQVGKYQDNEQISMLRDKLSAALAIKSKIPEKGEAAVSEPPTRGGEYTMQTEIDELIEWMKNH